MSVKRACPATNNVRKVMNCLGRRKPTYVDSCVKGYRVRSGFKSGDEDLIKAEVEFIKVHTRIEVTYRKRGTGCNSYLVNTYDYIIPFADEMDDIVSYQFS